jgi:hypothetical protein
MDQGFINIIMEINIVVVGMKIKNKVKGLFRCQLEMFILVDGVMVKNKEEEYIISVILIFMKV